jgi:hypothetical protein
MKTTNRRVRAKDGGKSEGAQPFPCAWRINKDGTLTLPLELSAAESKALRLLAHEYMGISEAAFCREAVVFTMSALTDEVLDPYCRAPQEFVRRARAQLREPMREIFATENLIANAPSALTDPQQGKARAA